MDDLIKLVRTFRVTSGLAERQRLGDKIFEAIEPGLHRFIFGAVHRDDAEEVFQEAAKDIAVGLDKFRNNTNGEFRGWWYRIARNKVANYIRKKAKNRLLPMDPEQLWEMVADDARTVPLSAADRIDLKDAIALLDAAKPGCSEYLLQYYVMGLDYGEIAAEENISDNAMRMRIGRCLDEARALVA